MTEEKKPFAETFYINKENGAFTEISKEILREKFNTAPNTSIKVSLKEGTKGKFTPTRYKYYFACFLPSIFFESRDDFTIIETDTETGEVIERQPKDKDELHECLKIEFNNKTIIDRKSNRVYTTGTSTKGMSDRDFIGKYIESMQEKYLSPPYLCDIVFYEEWKLANGEKGEGWDSLKSRIKYYEE